MYKYTNTTCKPKRIRLFALIVNCTILMKTNFRFSRNVYTISDRTWCNKHLRHTTTEKYENNGKGGYFRFDDDNNMSYRYILSITLLQWASWTPTTPYCIIHSEFIRYINNIICINSYNSTGTIITRNITNVTWQQVSEMIDMNRWIQWLFPWRKEKSDFLHVSPSLKNYITLCFETVKNTIFKDVEYLIEMNSAETTFLSYVTNKSPYAEAPRPFIRITNHTSFDYWHRKQGSKDADWFHRSKDVDFAWYI